jgi:hypothetical protein
MVADGFLQEGAERAESHRRADLLGLFTEGNEGNEDQFSSHITRFVLLVTFCSIFRIRPAIGGRIHFSASSAASCKTKSGFQFQWDTPALAVETDAPGWRRWKTPGCFHRRKVALAWRGVSVL